MLDHNDRGDEVIAVQKKLQELGYYTYAIDGIYGKGTQQAVIDFQQDHSLKVDGVYGGNTRDKLQRVYQSRQSSQQKGSISDNTYHKMAQRLDVEVAVLKAFAAVESNGQGFFSDGRPAILFERHYMARMLEKRGLHLLKNIASQALPDVVNSSPGGYQGGEAEYERYNKASQLHPQAAIESCSWGLFQIMGSHYNRLGFNSPEDFKSAMFQGVNSHLEAVVRFIETDANLHQALRNRDFTTSARIYNGPNYDQHNPPYDERLRQAYQRYA